MMYLEDYLESIEDLPNEFKDMLVTIRELDLMVQNAMDEKAKDTKAFLHKARKMQPVKRESMYQSLMSDFGKILEDADEKVNIAERLENLLVNRLEMLDRELAQFKINLEAENPGITSAIEERVAKSDVQDTDARVTQKRKKFTKSRKKSPVNSSTASSVDEEPSIKSVPILDNDKKSTNNKKKSSASSSTVSSIDEMPAMKPFTILGSVQEKENVNNSTVTLNVKTSVLPGVELTFDPTPYCICQQVSYGEMIACDNSSCPYEWFHYPCVNVTTAPEGIWYCPSCRINMVSTAGDGDV